MPGFDRTGPLGRGPMTGGRHGLCARPSPEDDFTLASECRGGYGMGRGCGRGARRGGGGRGHRNEYYATGLHGWERGRGVALTDDERADALKARERALADELDRVRASLVKVSGEER
jgi:hypothetical protein